MIISTKTSANILLSSPTTINSLFLGASLTGAASGTTAVQTQSVTETPPAYTQTVSLQAPDYTEDVTFNPPPYVSRSGKLIPVPAIKKPVTVKPLVVRMDVTIQPPAVTFETTVSVPVAGAPTVSNTFGAVGIMQSTPLRLVALVRPNVIAGALHYALPAGAVVRFIGPSGYEDRTVAKVALTSGDLQLYYLDQPVSVVKPVGICSLGASAMANKEIVTFGLIGSRAGNGAGWEPAAATNKIGRVMVDGNAGTWNATCQMLTFQLEPGDSGGPSFVMENGVPSFLGSTRKISSNYEVNVATPVAAAINAL